MDEYYVLDEQSVEITRRMTMNLIDTYLYEVGRRLPRKNRMDIEAEIRSALQDLLDDHSRETGKSVDDEMVLGVLKNYGDPDKVAASYQGDRYLIGPRLYPVFLKVLRIFFPVIAILAGFGAIINASLHVPSVDNISALYLSVLVGVATTAISALGNLVLIFAVIEWYLRHQGSSSYMNGVPSTKEWDPRSLTRISPPNQVKLFDTIFEIVGSFAAILIFNLYPQVFSLGLSANGGWYIGTGSWGFIPLLSHAFYTYLPYLTVIWTLTIILNIILLRMGVWSTRARIASIGLKSVGIFIAVRMLFDPTLINVSEASLTAAGFTLPPDTMGAMIFGLAILLGLILILVIVLSAFDIIKSTIRAFKSSIPQKMQ